MENRGTTRREFVKAAVLATAGGLSSIVNAGRKSASLSSAKGKKLDVVVDSSKRTISLNGSRIELGNNYREPYVFDLPDGERAVTLIYAEQDGEDSEEMIDDAGEIYSTLERVGLGETYSVSPSYLDIDENPEIFIPHLTIYGPRISGSFIRNGIRTSFG